MEAQLTTIYRDWPDEIDIIRAPSLFDLLELVRHWFNTTYCFEWDYFEDNQAPPCGLNMHYNRECTLDFPLRTLDDLERLCRETSDILAYGRCWEIRLITQNKNIEIPK